MSVGSNDTDPSFPREYHRYTPRYQVVTCTFTCKGPYLLPRVWVWPWVDRTGPAPRPITGIPAGLPSVSGHHYCKGKGKGEDMVGKGMGR